MLSDDSGPTHRFISEPGPFGRRSVAESSLPGGVSGVRCGDRRLPHAGQSTASGAPHLAQNFAGNRISVPHLPHLARTLLRFNPQLPQNFASERLEKCYFAAACRSEADAFNCYSIGVHRSINWLK